MDHTEVRYQIGRFMQITQLTRKALRLYEKQGLLCPAYVDPFTGYRYYDETQVEPARLIRLLREMEMPLALIQRVLGANVETAIHLIDNHEKEIANRAHAVGRTAKVVKKRLQKDLTMTFEILEKNVPAMQVASRLSRVKIADFQEHIKTTLHLLADHIQQHGAIAGDPMCFYHGKVNEDADGPVEIVWPFSGDVPKTDVIDIRTLPAHKLAYHAAEMSHSRFPEILQVWDAVVDYARSNGYDARIPEGLICYEIWPEDMTVTVAWPFTE